MADRVDLLVTECLRRRRARGSRGEAGADGACDQGSQFNSTAFTGALTAHGTPRFEASGKAGSVRVHGDVRLKPNW